MSVRVAWALWLAWAVIVWNVVFDRVIVVAGRQYIHAAYLAAANAAVPYARSDDWMRPAATRALWEASLAGVAVVALGFLLIGLARRRGRD